MFNLRYDLRRPDFARVTSAELAAAALEQCEYADRNGFLSITLSEHHGSPDGYLPSPLVFAAAVAARTRQARLVIVALPSATGGERVVSQIRQLYPQLRILARVPDRESVEPLRAAVASAVVVDGLTTARDLAERAVLLYEPGEPAGPPD